MNLVITGSEPIAIAGESYLLHCSLTGIDQERVHIMINDNQWTWIRPPNAITGITESHNGITSNFQFHRLNKSTHSGNYVCQIRIGSIYASATYHLQINSKTATILCTLGKV